MVCIVLDMDDEKNPVFAPARKAPSPNGWAIEEGVQLAQVTARQPQICSLPLLETVYHRSGPPSRAISLVLLTAASASAQVRPEQDAINLAPREVIDRLRADPMAYFRFVNRPWIARVCDIFADDIRDLPIVRLHGDAHVEQFTVTREAWGMDDFDDSVEGPAVVDIVRFLGSVDLVARQRRMDRRT
jgi:hypothetical protein